MSGQRQLFPLFGVFLQKQPKNMPLYPLLFAET